MALNTIYVAQSIDSKQPIVADILKKKSGWTPVERQNDVFDLSDCSLGKTCYIAIPLSNGSDYDPFINLRMEILEEKCVLMYLEFFEPLPVPYLLRR